MSKFSPLFPLLAAALAPAPALAAALSMGGGSGLIPKEGARPQLLQETVELSPVEGSPCYELREDTASAAGLLQGGPAVGCQSAEKTLLRPQWKAVDLYRLAPATTGSRAVFELPLRLRKITSSLAAVGARDVRLWVDGLEVPGGLRWADGKAAWVFKTDLPSGREVRIQTSQEFDVEYFDSEAEGATYPKGSPPWLTRQLAAASGPGRPIDSVSALRRVPFMLTSSSWDASPKTRITVRAHLPRGVPETLVSVSSPSASCLGRRLIAFDAVAKDGGELAFAFPQPWSGPTRLETGADWSAWKRSVGGESVALTCDLQRRLVLDSGPGAQARLNSEKCVLGCDQARQVR